MTNFVRGEKKNHSKKPNPHALTSFTHKGPVKIKQLSKEHKMSLVEMGLEQSSFKSYYSKINSEA